MQDFRDLANLLKEKSENCGNNLKSGTEKRWAQSFLKGIFYELDKCLKSQQTRNNISMTLGYEGDHGLFYATEGIHDTLTFFDKSDTKDYSEVIKKHYLYLSMLQEKIDIDLMMSIIETELNNAGFSARVIKHPAIEQVRHKWIWVHGWAVHVYVEW